MKTLFVLRHAKSSWDSPELSDFERPLNERGEEAAPFMGELMKEKNLAPDLIVSSPAERAKQTATLVKNSAEFDAEIRFNERIYEASPLTLIHIISEFDDKFDSAMIVGHNPGLESLVRILSGERHRMPTAALALIELDIENWSEIAANSGNLREFFIPKEEMENFQADWKN